MLLHEIFDVRRIKLHLESETKEESFEELVEMIKETQPELDRNEMLDAIISRENEMNTFICPGIAVPHGYYHNFNGVIGALGISPTGIVYNTEDYQTVNCIFMILMGGEARNEYLNVLQRLLRLLKSQGVEGIQSAKNTQEIFEILRGF